MDQINKMLDFIENEGAELTKSQIYDLVSEASNNLHLKPSYERELYHRVNGVHSGIPRCCVDYFIELLDNYVPAALYTSYVRGGALRDTAGYVVCPACYMENRLVRVNQNGVVAKFLIEGVNG